MALITIHYVFVGPDATLLDDTVPPPVTVLGNTAVGGIDVQVDSSVQADLDETMLDLGFVRGTPPTLSFRRVIAQPVDGTDFAVVIPGGPVASGAYFVQATQENGASIVGIQCPNGVGDRTATQFRVMTSAALDTGDTINFTVTF